MEKKFKSARLNALDAAGKIKKLTASVSKATLTHPRPKSSKGGKAGPLQQTVKIVSYQQVEEGVFIQQVRVKTIKVGITMFFWL